MRIHIVVGPIVIEQLTKQCDGRVTVTVAAVAAAMLALLKQTASPVLIMPQAFVMNSRLRILNFFILNFFILKYFVCKNAKKPHLTFFRILMRICIVADV